MCEKWSDKGHEIYAIAVASIITEHMGLSDPKSSGDKYLLSI